MMARQLTPLGRLLLVLAGLSLVGYGLYKYGVLGRMAGIVAPEKRAEGTVSRDDFGASPAAAPESTPAGTTSSASLGGGTRLNRPIKVAIVLWGGYAGGIMANGGLAPNKDSVFSKDFGVQVELLQIDDFTKSRDAFPARGGPGGGRNIWAPLHPLPPEYRRP